MRLAVLLAISVLAGPAVRAQQPGGVVEGEVLSAIDGRPIRKASIVLRGNRPGQGQALNNYVTETDGDGRFSVAGVATGEYVGIASRAGFAMKPPDQLRVIEYSPPFTVAAGSRVQIDLLMTPLGVITGKVLSPEGTPLRGVSVQALQSGPGTGPPAAPLAVSDDRGEYRLFDLFPGRYILRADKGASMLSAYGRDIEIRGGPPALAYSTTYYPDQLRQEDSSVIEVKPGVEVGGIDLRVQRTRRYAIRGTLPAGAGDRVMVTVRKVPADRSFQVFPPRPKDGRYEIAGLPAGSYLVIAQTMPQNAGQAEVPRIARRVVEIQNQDVDGADLEFSVGLEISGRVTVAGSTKVALENLRGVLTPMEPATGRSAAAPVAADGSFTLRGVLPDVYRLGMGLPNAVYLSSVKIGGRDVTGQPIDLSSGSTGRLEVTVSGDMGSFQAMVTDEQGLPARAINVTLVPDQSLPDWQQRFRNQLTGPLGRINMPNVVPGEYEVFAWRDAPRNAPRDAEFRKPFADRAVKVVIKPGETQTVQLKPIVTQGVAAAPAR